MLERLNEEIKRRMLVVRIFPEQLSALGPCARRRNARKLDRSDTLSEYGFPEGASQAVRSSSDGGMIHDKIQGYYGSTGPENVTYKRS